MKLKYAIFDFDMTLIDSIIPLMTSANLLAEEFGLRQVTYDEVYLAEISVPNCTFELLWTALWGYCDPKWFEAYQARFSEAEYQAMTLYPTGKETLEALAAMNVPLGLASNRDYPRKALKMLGIEYLFQAVVGQFDVVKTKPDPEMILKAMDIMAAVPEETIYVCDSKGDLAAAQAAGVRTLAMTTGGHNAEILLSLGAWRTGDQLLEVLDLFRY